MIDTGKTLTLAAKTLHEKGARSVHVLISHGKEQVVSFFGKSKPLISFAGLLSETNLGLIDSLPIEQLVVSAPVLS